MMETTDHFPVKFNYQDYTLFQTILNEEHNTEPDTEQKTLMVGVL